jgi:hypothetical protein
MKSPAEQHFDAHLTARGPKGAWVFLPIPFDVQAVFGSRSKVPVAGTLNGVPFRLSLQLEGDGTHVLAVNKELQSGAKAKPGDLVQVTLRRDETERTVDLPEELQHQLSRESQASAFFASLAYSCKKEYADWIASAKKPETRTARAIKATEMLRAGTKRVR